MREQARRGSLREAATQARRAVELAQTQYREGLSDFQSVLDSERALAELEDELAQSDAAIATQPRRALQGARRRLGAHAAGPCAHALR